MMWWMLACQGGTSEDLPGVRLDEADRVVFVGESFELNVLANGAPTWDLGDGGVEEGLTISHVYESPGIYTVSVEVVQGGRAATEQMLVTAVWEPLAAPPRMASAVVTDGETIYAVLQDHDLVAVVDASSLEVKGHYATCGEPRSLDLEDGQLLVTCREDAAWTLEASTGQVLSEAEGLPVGARPFGGVLVDGRGVLSTDQGLYREADQLLEEGQGFRDLRGLAVSEGSLLVARCRGLDEGLSVWIDGEERLLEPDAGPDSDTDARGHLGFVNRIAVRPDGRAFVVGGNKANMERGLVRDGQALTHDTTVRADLRQVGLHPDEVDLPEPAFDNRDLVSAMAYSPWGDRLYVAHHGAGIVDVLNPWTVQRMGGWQGLGAGLEGLVALEGQDGVRQVWVLNRLDRALTLLSEDASPVVIDLVEGLDEPLDEQVLLGRRVFYDAGDRRMSLDSYASCGSCHLDGESDQHVWDFTDRGEGLRNTTSLLGNSGISPLHWSANFDEVQDFEHDIRGPQQGTGFLSDEDWAATSSTLGAPKAGLSEELDALAAYVESLTEVPPSPYEGSAEGEAIFLEAGCADCHSGERFTDSGFDSEGRALLHDVGTLSETSGMRLGGELTGLDTPTLRGLWLTAPYLHDGSAEALMEVLVERNLEDQHGQTSLLSTTELQQLELYLLSLD